MTHRRYLPQPHSKPEPIEVPPFRNNEHRLKQIYEAQLLFKEKPKDLSLRRSNHKPHPRQPLDLVQPKPKAQLQQLNLAEIKGSQRYRESERDSYHLYQSNEGGEKSRQRQRGEPAALTTRRDEGSTDRNELFKIKRKSISGSLRKKLKQQAAHHVSANPVLPTQMNYYEQGRKLYKEGRISEAMRLFELCSQQNPLQADSLYYQSLCLLTKHNYHRAFQVLNKIIEQFPGFSKKTVYLFSAIACKNIGRIERAMGVATAGISKYPDYLDLRLYRAKMLQQNGDYEQAHQDYEIILKSRKDSAEVLLRDAMCLKELGRLSNCLSMLNSAFYCDQSGQLKGQILMQRIKVYYQEKKVKQCKKDIIKLQEIQPQTCELHYYKGLIYLEENNRKAALLSFQRCIRSNTCKQAVGRSLVQIAKSKIEDRDFYSAYHHIGRAQHLQVNSDEIDKFRLFAEGVVFMMKRKISEGIEDLYQLQRLHSPIGDYFNKLYYLYRAYGHFMLNQHSRAIEDYCQAQKYLPSDKFVQYNQLVAEGIVRVKQKKFDEALKKFDAAQTVVTSVGGARIQPLIYRAISFIEKVKAGKTGPADDLAELEEVFIALKQLDKAYDVNDGNSNMLYLRALIYLYLGKTDDGLQDIVKAISKSQENVAKYFFYRALAHETLGNKKQALNDFNICINLDEKMANGYLERGKLLFSNDQASKGLQDIRKYKELKPEVDEKLIQCSLHYIHCSFDQSESCVEHIKDVADRKRMQILLHFKQMKLVQIRDLLESRGDRMICQVMLGHWSVKEEGPEDLKIFNRMEYYCYLGIKYFGLGSYEEAISHFSYALKQKSLMDLQDSPQGSNEQVDEEQQDSTEAVIEAQTKQNELHFLNYNLFLSYLANSDRKKAYQVFIRDILPSKEHFLRSQIIGAFSRLLFQAIKVKEGDPQTHGETFQIELFRSLIGETVDYIEITLPNFILRTKLCYPMPYASDIFLHYSAKINPSFILDCLGVGEVQNRPQPPWVKRNNMDLVFTDDLVDINIEFETTEQDDESEKQEEDYEGEGQEEQQGDEQEQESGVGEESEEREVPFDPRKFRDQMKLDDNIERKLQKIMQGKKRTQ